MDILGSSEILLSDYSVRWRGLMNSLKWQHLPIVIICTQGSMINSMNINKRASSWASASLNKNRLEGHSSVTRWWMASFVLVDLPLNILCLFYFYPVILETSQTECANNEQLEYIPCCSYHMMQSSSIFRLWIKTKQPDSV